MTPTAQGRHCAACQKTVVDFTHQSDAQIQAHLRQAGRAGVCGRFSSAQLGRPLQPSHAPAEAPWRTWLALTLALWASRESAAPAALAQTPTEQRQPQPPAYLRSADETQLRLRGRVTDSATNEGMPGVTVQLLDSPYGVATDVEGSFELVFPASSWHDGQSAVSFKYIGYYTIKLPLQNKPSAVGEPLRIVMSWDSAQKADTMVTALGGAFYRPPVPAARRTFWYWLTRPFRR